MEFRHLRYFVVLAEELHFGRAAKRLDRDSRSVQLTPAGHAFLVKAKDLLAQAEQAARGARDVAQGLAGSLRVGFVGSMLQMGLPQRLHTFQASYAQLSVSLVEASSAEQLEALRQDRIDVGFVHTTLVPTGLESRLVASQPFVLCLSSSHALVNRLRSAKRDATVALCDVGPVALVSVARAVSPDYFDAITQTCAQAGWEPVARHELRHWLSVVSLVAQGQGVAIVPKALERAGVPGVVFAPIDDALPVNQTYCVWRSHRAHEALNAFLQTWPPVYVPAQHSETSQ